MVVMKAWLTDALEAADCVTTSAVSTDTRHRHTLVDIWLQHQRRLITLPCDAVQAQP